MHEYTVFGHKRENIIYYLAVLSITLATVISTLEKSFPLIAKIPISSSLIFGGLYILYNKYIWKIKFLQKCFSFPNIDGEWDAEGESINRVTNETFNWTGIITIRQDWNKMLISQATSTSNSNSLSIIGGIRHNNGNSYTLSYHYSNTPDILDSELKKHEGFCSLNFKETLNEAEGYFFNNPKDRATYGKIKLRKRS